jgi:hypothetical protein
MSQQTRQWVCDRLVFQDDTQQSDLLNENLTQTNLIALLEQLLKLGAHIEVTAVRSDHHDDSNLAQPPYIGTHAHGWAIDLWPLIDSTPGNYVDAGTETFRDFLTECARLDGLFQIGLAGSADTPENHVSAGPTCFSDDGADHVHISAHA